MLRSYSKFEILGLLIRNPGYIATDMPIKSMQNDAEKNIYWPTAFSCTLFTIEKNPEVCSSLKPFFSANIGNVKERSEMQERTLQSFWNVVSEHTAQQLVYFHNHEVTV